MKVNKKHIMSMTLATLITAGSTGIYAASFKDVSSKHWAVSYIESCQKAGLLKGYGDGTFQPSVSMPRIQVLVALGRTLEPSKEESTKALSTHKSELVKNNIPDWAMGELSVMLSRGIIDKEELKTLVSENRAETMINRERLSMLLVNVLGLQDEVKAKGNVTKVPFTDASEFSKSRMAHVLVINDKKIMTGDDKKAYRPKYYVSRAEMAKILDLTYKYKHGGDTNTPETPKPAEPSVNTVLGTIFNTFSLSNEDYIVVDTVLGEKKTYKLDKNSVLKLDDKDASLKDLVVGMSVKLEVKGETADTKGTVVTLKGGSLFETLNGTVTEIRDTGTKTITISYSENGAEKSRFLTVQNDAEVLLDGNKASFGDVKARDKISVEIVNGKVTKIDAKTTTRTWSGKLREVDVKNRSITIETTDGTRTLFGLSKEAVINRNDKAVEISNLKSGDQIDISVENNLVTRIDAKVVSKQVTGLVQRTTIGYNIQEITISNSETKQNETYKIPANAEVLLDGQAKSLENFKLGYFTTINLEGDEVVRVEGQSTVSSKYLGKVASKNENALTMLLADGKTLSVDLSNTTIYKDDSGKTLTLQDVSVGDTVLVTSESYQNSIMAKEIMKLK